MSTAMFFLMITFSAWNQAQTQEVTDDIIIEDLQKRVQTLEQQLATQKNDILNDVGKINEANLRNKFILLSIFVAMIGIVFGVIVNILIGSRLRHMDNHLDQKANSLQNQAASEIKDKVASLTNDWEEKSKNFTHVAKVKILIGLSMSFYEIFESHINHENYNERSAEILPRLENDIMMAVNLSRGAHEEVQKLDDNIEKNLYLKAKNNLAYFLALKEQNLEEAKSLAIQALELEANDHEVKETYVYVMIKCKVTPMDEVNEILRSLLTDHRLNENWKLRTKKKIKALYQQQGLSFPKI